MSFRGISSCIRPLRVTSFRRNAFGATRFHSSRDKYFLKPLRETVDEPTYDYRFLSEPATVEVSLPPHLDSITHLHA